MNDISIYKIKEAQSTDELADMLENYCALNNLKLESADLLLMDAISQVQWLQEFCDRWTQKQAKEDCLVEGHRDTGRGICCYCGECI